MTAEDLEYIKNTIQFALDNGNFTDSDMESFYSCANNSINVIDDPQAKLKELEGKKEQCLHPRSEREYIGQNMLRCKVCGKEFS